MTRHHLLPDRMAVINRPTNASVETIDHLFKKWCWKDWTPICKISKYIQINKNADLEAHTKLNSTWIIDLNVKSKTLELSEENTGENLCDPSWGKLFLDTKSVVCKKNDKPVSIRIKNLCSERCCWENRNTRHSLRKSICKSHVCPRICMQDT